MRLVRILFVLIVWAAQSWAIDFKDPRVARRLERWNDDFVEGPGRAAVDRARPPKALAAIKTATVDCAKGQSIQQAIDQVSQPDVVEVHGICNENVVIRRIGVTLRGFDPTVDGIQGVATSPAVSPLLIGDGFEISIENLSVSGGLRAGITIVEAGVNLRNCRIVANAAGMSVAGSSFVRGTDMTISQNQGRGIVAQGDSLVFCFGCQIESNGGFAGSVTRGAVMSFLDSVVSGRRGLVASDNGSYVDVDCINALTTHPCVLDISGSAALAFGNATVALLGLTEFKGQLTAADRGEVALLGARQLATGQPGMGPASNSVSEFGLLIAVPEFDEAGVLRQSQLFGQTRVDTFGRLLLEGVTTLSGSIQCGRAGDAWVDATVIGGTITGCEHAARP